MALPYYVSPEQFMKDKADYAKKGIALGKSALALEYSDGILFVAENPSSSLYKISEIYDRVAFAAVGKFNEFEALRMHGIRQADVQGYSYSRLDVTARALANSYSQILGQIFTVELKPYEVELLIAEVGENGEKNQLFRILYDGTVTDEENFVVLGGTDEGEGLKEYLSGNYKAGLTLAQALKLGVKTLVTVEERELPAEDVEAAVLDNGRDRRKFRRLTDEEVAGILK